MFELMNKLDVTKPIGVALSGGVDSMAMCKYLIEKKFDVIIVFFNHDNDYANDEMKFVATFAAHEGLPFLLGSPSRTQNKDESREEYWRNSRYEFFNSLKMQVATGHTLTDAVEWYLFTCFHGEGHLLPYQHANVIRPLLLTPKEKVIEYCKRRKIEWIEDASNEDVTFAARNRIRHKILPEVLKINPGIHKVLKKKLLTKYRMS